MLVALFHTREKTDVLCLVISGSGGEFDNAGAMMSIDDTLMCSFKVLKPVKKK